MVATTTSSNDESSWAVARPADYPAFSVPVKVGCPGITLGDRQGIDVAVAVLAHERRHQEIVYNWKPGGAWPGWIDSDDPTPADKSQWPADNLPDAYEIASTQTLTDNDRQLRPGTRSQTASMPTTATRSSTPGWQSLATAASAANDWAYPGKQSNPPYLADVPTGPDRRTILPMPAAGPRCSAPTAPLGPSTIIWIWRPLTGSYADAAMDTDADGLYNALRLSAGVLVTGPRSTTWSPGWRPAREAGSPGRAPQGTLLTGTHTIDLLFDGRLIQSGRRRWAVPHRPGGAAGRSGRDSDRRRQCSPTTTTAYAHTQFDPYDIAIAGPFSDAGRDTGGDGKHDFLDRDRGVERGGGRHVQGQRPALQRSRQLRGQRRGDRGPGHGHAGRDPLLRRSGDPPAARRWALPAARSRRRQCRRRRRWPSL